VVCTLILGLFNDTLSTTLFMQLQTRGDIANAGSGNMSKDEAACYLHSSSQHSASPLLGWNSDLESTRIHCRDANHWTATDGQCQSGIELKRWHRGMAYLTHYLLYLGQWCTTFFLSKGYIAKLRFVCGPHNVNFIKNNRIFILSYFPYFEKLSRLIWPRVSVYPPYRC
jgi:hypothetical protein